jgi:hypothetical protein
VRIVTNRGNNRDHSEHPTNKSAAAGAPAPNPTYIQLIDELALLTPWIAHLNNCVWQLANNIKNPKKNPKSPALRRKKRRNKPPTTISN